MSGRVAEGEATAAGVERRFTCTLCEAACGLRVTLGDGRTRVRANPDDVLSRGHLCPKAHALGELYDDPDRLRAPMRRTARGFEPVGWDEALGEAAARLRAVRARHGKNAVALYVGNPTVHGHRASLGSQVLAVALGTQSRFDPNSQDSNPRLFACMQLYGDALSMSVPDLERTDHLLVLGANPAASNGSQVVLGDPRRLFDGIRARGGTIVLVDPRRTETAAWCTRHHFIRPGGDAALLFAMVSVLFAEGRVDERRIGFEVAGLDALRRLAEPFTPSRVAGAIGMDAGVIRALALDLADAPRASVYSRVGPAQGEFGPVVAWLVEVLNVLTGHLDREGGAMFPTPAADIGPIARLLIGNRWGRFRSRVRGLPELLGALPSAAMAEEIETPGEGQIRALVCFAGNPVLSTPNGERLARALPKLDVMIAVDPYLNETTRHADLVLPPVHVFATGNFDLVLSRFGVRNHAKYSPPIAPRTAGARDDWDILCELALGVAGPDVPGLARAATRALAGLPERVVDLLLRAGPYRLTLERLRDAPNGLDLGPLVPSKGAFVRTADRRVSLAPPALAADVPRVLRWVDAGPGDGLVLIGRRHLRDNNSWLHNLPSVAKGPDRARLFVHPDDAARRGLASGARVRVRSRVGEVAAIVETTADVMPGVVSLAHGFGHAAAAEWLRVAGALAGPNVNALTDDQRVEPVIGTSILNGVPVEILADEPA